MHLYGPLTVPGEDSASPVSTNTALPAGSPESAPLSPLPPPLALRLGIGGFLVLLSSRSQLTWCWASTAVTSFTMPGRSAPSTRKLNMVFGWEDAESRRFMRARWALGWSETSITSLRVTCNNCVKKRRERKGGEREENKDERAQRKRREVQLLPYGA